MSSTLKVSPGSAFSGAAVAIDDTPAVVAIAALDGTKGIPVVTSLTIDSGAADQTDLVKVLTGTTVKFIAAGKRAYTDLMIVGAPGETVNATAISSGNSIIYVTGYHTRHVDTAFLLVSGAVAETAANNNTKYATLYTGVAGKRVIIERLILQQVIGASTANVIYANDAAGAGRVLLAPVADVAGTTGGLDLHSCAFIVPAGKFILLEQIETATAASMSFAYFHGHQLDD